MESSLMGGTQLAIASMLDRNHPQYVSYPQDVK